jgi:hypothetical protein
VEAGVIDGVGIEILARESLGSEEFFTIEEIIWLLELEGTFFGAEQEEGWMSASLSESVGQVSPAETVDPLDLQD